VPRNPAKVLHGPSRVLRLNISLAREKHGRVNREILTPRDTCSVVEREICRNNNNMLDKKAPRDLSLRYPYRLRVITRIPVRPLAKSQRGLSLPYRLDLGNVRRPMNLLRIPILLGIPDVLQQLASLAGRARTEAGGGRGLDAIADNLLFGNLLQIQR